MSGESTSEKPVVVKNEKTANLNNDEDKKLAEWAKELLNRPTSQILVSSSSAAANDPIPPNNGIDMASAIGKFSWILLDEDKFVPCLYRSDKKYVSIRMLEASVMNEYIKILPEEAYDGISIESYMVTVAECKLLTYVNNFHCDGLYGAEPFSVNDLIIHEKDVETLYYYLKFAYEVTMSGGKNYREDYSKCGFVKVNNGSLVPYTVLSDGERVVPLFYFEGQLDILKESASPLKGWPLCYLKICCRVQGVRKHLIQTNSLLTVTLNDLISYFPKRTDFQDNCWPVVNSKNQFQKFLHEYILNSNKTISYRLGNLASHVKILPTDLLPNYILMTPAATAASLSNTDSLSKLTAYGTRPVNSYARVSPTPATVSDANSVPSLETGLGSSSSSIPSTASNHQISRTNAIPPSTVSVPSISATSSSSSNSNGIKTVKMSDISKIRLPEPPSPSDIRKLTSIPGVNGSVRGAYTVRLIMLEKEYFHCINKSPFSKSDFLLVFQDFLSKSFPEAQVFPTGVTVFHSAGIPVYLPNTTQLATLRSYGFPVGRAWEIPLIPAQETATSITRLRIMFQSYKTSIAPSQSYPRSYAPPLPSTSHHLGNYNAYYSNTLYSAR